MRRNLLHYQRALFLRKKKGYSYNEIRAEIPVAKSTLSLWLRTIALSPDQQQRLKEKRPEGTWSLGEWNREKRQKEITAIRVQAKRAIGKLTKREFLIAGLMLYWAEGNKVSKIVAVSNADPLLISFMMSWFRLCLRITEDRFHVAIHYHQGQDPRIIEKFWSALTRIPLERFRKPFCKPPGTGHRKHYLQWGVCRVYLSCSANLLHEILAWKDGLIEDVISGKQKELRP